MSGRNFELVRQSDQARLRQPVGRPRLAKIDLNELSLTELKQLQKEVQHAIEGFEGRKKQDAVAALEARAQELGFTLADLVGLKKTRKSSGPVGPKYRHPENPLVTWSGRGRQPRWFRDALAAGAKAEALAV